jgi:hypothetical protein
MLFIGFTFYVHYIIYFWHIQYKKGKTHAEKEFLHIDKSETLEDVHCDFGDTRLSNIYLLCSPGVGNQVTRIFF